MFNIRLKILLSNIALFQLRICLFLLNLFSFILNNVIYNINLFKYKFYLKHQFKIKNKHDINKFLLMNEDGNIESLYFPKIHNHSLGGEIKIMTKGIQVYEFQDVCYSLNSDFIRFKDQSIFCDKITRTESIFSEFGDIDFVNFNNDKIWLTNYSKTTNFDYVFHLTGCFSKVWTHFLVQYYPKLDFLYLIPKTEKITIVLPNDIDPHIIYLIQFYLNEHNNVNIVKISNDTLIFCKKVVYVSIDTWLSDQGPIKTMFHIQISNHTVNFVLNQFKKVTDNILITKELKLTKNKKLFIGRSGKRNIENYTEILEYFQSLGFIEIFPHLLTIEEKIELFSSAEFITGPASSGFANIIFCQNKPQVLVLINLSRHDDMLLTKFAKIMGINFETFIGKEKSSGHGDSDYLIDTFELKNFINNNFSI